MNGLIVDNSGEIIKDDPEELEWQAKMLQAKQKADALYNEDDDSEDDEAKGD